MNQITVPQMMTPKQVQAQLGITWDQLFSMVKSNQITSYCIYGTFRFKPADVAACKSALGIQACQRSQYIASFNPCGLA